MSKKHKHKHSNVEYLLNGKRKLNQLFIPINKIKEMFPQDFKPLFVHTPLDLAFKFVDFSQNLCWFWWLVIAMAAIWASLFWSRLGFVCNVHGCKSKRNMWVSNFELNWCLSMQSIDNAVDQFESNEQAQTVDRLHVEHTNEVVEFRLCYA